MDAGSPVRVYRLGSEVKLDEGKRVEFKQHRVVTDECMNGDQDGRLKPYSHTINAFTNTEGGVLYGGITDQGMVKGLSFTSNQKLHFSMLIRDMHKRFTPPLPKEKVHVKYIPVLDREEEAYHPDPFLPTPEDIWRKHTLRSAEDCWCDLAAKAGMEMGRVPPLYVVEIHVDRSEEQCTNEQGSFFLRGHASNRRQDLIDLQQLAAVKL